MATAPENQIQLIISIFKVFVSFQTIARNMISVKTVACKWNKTVFDRFRIRSFAGISSHFWLLDELFQRINETASVLFNSIDVCLFISLLLTKQQTHKLNFHGRETREIEWFLLNTEWTSGEIHYTFGFSIPSPVRFWLRIARETRSFIRSTVRPTKSRTNTM